MQPLIIRYSEGGGFQITFLFKNNLTISLIENVLIQEVAGVNMKLKHVQENSLARPYGKHFSVQYCSSQLLGIKLSGNFRMGREVSLKINMLHSVKLSLIGPSETFKPDHLEIVHFKSWVIPCFNSHFSKHILLTHLTSCIFLFLLQDFQFPGKV